MSSQTEVLKPRLLIIDDDKDITEYIMAVGEEMEFSVKYVHEFDLAISAIEEFDPDVIFLDLHLKKHDGIEVLNFLAEKKCEAKIVLISGLHKTTLESASLVGKQRKLNIIGTLIKPFMIEDIEEELTLALDTSSRFTSDELQTILGNGEFVLLYQPIMPVKIDGKSVIAGVEVKPHWETEAGHSLSPSQFIPPLRDSNYLQTFSYLLVDKTFESVKYWITSDLNIGITFNITELDLSDITWLNHLNDATENLAIPRNQITISISYHAIKHRLDSVLAILTRLRISGFRVSIETVESDIEELDKILHLPIDELRVRDVFVDQIGSNMETEFNVSTLISIANKMGLSTCAAGVDSYIKLSFLNDCGCKFALGPFIGKELNAKEVAPFIRANISIADSTGKPVQSSSNLENR